MISVLILTLDEEANLAGCLESIPWKDDVHVLDSGSVDRTKNIAQAANVNFHLRKFTNYADQRNFGLTLPFKNEWILMLDADERVSSELSVEIESIIHKFDSPITLYRVRRKDMFMSRWLRRSSGYPTWFPRLFRRGCVIVERPINEEYVTTGEIKHLNSHLIHFPFNKGMNAWFEKHNSYSAFEAEALSVEREAHPVHLSSLFVRDPVQRRKVLKQIIYRLPARPFLIFFYLYFLRGGFLDGRAGYHFAMMRMAYEIMIDAKIANAVIR